MFRSGRTIVGTATAVLSTFGTAYSWAAPESVNEDCEVEGPSYPHMWHTLWQDGPLSQARLVSLASKMPFARNNIEAEIDILIAQCSSDECIYESIRELWCGVAQQLHSNSDEEREWAVLRGHTKASEILDLCQLAGVNVGLIRSLADVGCGDGSITTALGQRLGLQLSQVHGVVSRETRETALELSGVTYHDWASSLPLADSSQDLVVCGQVLHHCSSPDDLVREMTRVLKPGGTLVIREHDGASWQTRVLCDVEHGLWRVLRSDSAAWAAGRGMDDYFSDGTRYRSFSAWTSNLCSLGLEASLILVRRVESNPTDIGYMIFTKPCDPKD